MLTKLFLHKDRTYMHDFVQRAFLYLAGSICAETDEPVGESEYNVSLVYKENKSLR